MISLSSGVEQNKRFNLFGKRIEKVSFFADL